MQVERSGKAENRITLRLATKIVVGNVVKTLTIKLNKRNVPLCARAARVEIFEVGKLLTHSTFVCVKDAATSLFVVGIVYLELSDAGTVKNSSFFLLCCNFLR